MRCGGSRISAGKTQERVQNARTTSDNMFLDVTRLAHCFPQIARDAPVAAELAGAAQSLLKSKPRTGK